MILSRQSVTVWEPVSRYLQAHSSVEKAGLITLVKMRFLPTDEQFSLRGDTLKQAIKEDKELGLVPFMVGTRQHTAQPGPAMRHSRIYPEWQPVIAED